MKRRDTENMSFAPYDVSEVPPIMEKGDSFFEHGDSFEDTEKVSKNGETSTDEDSKVIGKNENEEVA